MSPETKEKRNQLKSISLIARGLMETGAGENTINETIIKNFYTNDENKEFNTLNQWNEKGYKIIKGSKAFLVWGKPKENKEKEKESNENQPTDDDETKFYPLCYLFSNAQVEKKEGK